MIKILFFLSLSMALILAENSEKKDYQLKSSFEKLISVKVNLMDSQSNAGFVVGTSEETDHVVEENT